MSGLKQQMRVMDAVMRPENRAASPEATALWLAAGNIQDTALSSIDAGLLMIVRDKIEARLAANGGVS